MVFLDHVQHLHIHAVRAKILMSFSVDFRSLYKSVELFDRFVHLLIDRLKYGRCGWMGGLMD